MTQAEQFLSGRSDSDSKATRGADKSPAERFLRCGSFDAECRQYSSDTAAPRRSSGKAFKVLGVIVFVVLILIGTYFARISGPAILGYVCGAAALIIAPAIWKAGRG